jgi:hypothetical protein
LPALFAAINYTAASFIVGAHFDRYLIAGKDLYPKHPQFARQMAEYFSSIRKLDAEIGVWQRFEYLPLESQCFLV